MAGGQSGDKSYQGSENDIEPAHAPEYIRHQAADKKPGNGGYR